MFLHISWNTGDILYGKCTCKAGGGGYTNILLPVSIRWLIFSNQTQRKFHTVKHLMTFPYQGALFEDLSCKKVDADKNENSSRKRAVVTGRRGS